MNCVIPLQQASVCSLESGVLGQKVRKSLAGAGGTQCSQDKRFRKASTVNSPCPNSELKHLAFGMY